MDIPHLTAIISVMRNALICAAIVLLPAASIAQPEARSRLKIDFLEAASDQPSEPEAQPPETSNIPGVTRIPGIAPLPAAAPSPKKIAVANPRQIEEATGGRLGIALVDASGKMLLGFNRDERFALCSTFKAPLAAAVLMGAEKGRYGMEGTLPISQSDVLDYAPVVKANLKKGRLAIADLAKAAVEVSDNSAANILLPIVGGPEGLTSFLRAHGDGVTRLDRTEPTLNENAVGDERDTTSPAAIATVMARLLFADMPAPAAAQFREWLEGSTTGKNRIHAGLPNDWKSGDKTGSCGTAFNDVAVLRSPKDRDYVLAIYLDRPTVDDKAAEAAIANATRAAITILTEIEKRTDDPS